jgi:hypothetical protein
MIINPYIFGQPLLLDTYSGAAVAYSVRKLRTAYSGAALRVRRSSDNAESDIGFVANQLDTASLLSFVGAGNGFVTTWYDQSGNGRNASTAIASYQPRIVNSGVLEINANNKPAVRFIDTSTGAYANYITFPNWFAVSESWVGVFSVYQLNNLSYNNNIQGSSPNLRGFHLLHTTTGQPRTITYRTAATTGTGTALNASQVYLRYDLANRVNIQTYINGSGIPDINIADTNTNFILGSAIALGSSDSTAFTFDTPISEFIGYVTDQSSNKTGIETNIKNYFGI